MASKNRICVDFDAVIYDGANILPDCIEILSLLRKDYLIAIYSARLTDVERSQMEKLLNQNAVPYDEILPRKPQADYYIDDKAIKFIDWKTTVAQIKIPPLQEDQFIPQASGASAIEQIGKSKHLLIAIPMKTEQRYRDRAIACANTWLKDCACDYKCFSDADLGLVEKSQYDNAHDPIRTNRTRMMSKYAYDNNYDFLFRCDTDTYVWMNRLLACGFEQHDYMGWCLDYPKHLEIDRGLRTAHGGAGFFLSRKAMKIVSDTPPSLCSDGKFWGDIWTGEILWRHGIHCYRDTRFLDGAQSFKTHHGNIYPNELPSDHPYIAVHPCPASVLYEMKAKFPEVSAITVPPVSQLWEVPHNWNYGQRRPDICSCTYCRGV
jgi:hypothetical protein